MSNGSEQVTYALIEALLLVELAIDVRFYDGPVLFLRLLEVDLCTSAWQKNMILAQGGFTVVSISLPTASRWKMSKLLRICLGL